MSKRSLKERIKVTPNYEGALAATVANTGLDEKFLLNPDFYMHYEKYMTYGINNLDKAFELFKKHAVKRNPIYIYTDYDIDGIGCSVIMSLLCKKMGIKCEIYTPRRYSDGYGVTETFVQERYGSADGEQEDALLMTFDNGISAHEVIDSAKKCGWDVVVMDHHPARVINGEVVLPNADVIVDPHVTGGDFVDYCGAGLAYKFSQYVLDRSKFTEQEKEILLNKMCVQAAISTVGDSVPLKAENYQIVKKGTTLLSLGKCTMGLKLLCESPVRGMHGGLDLLGKNISSKDHLSYALCPACNANGRINDDGASEVFKLLSYDGVYSKEIADLREDIINANVARKEEVPIQTEAGIDYVYNTGQQNNKVLVVALEGCRLGFCGLVAAKLAEKFERPAFVVAPDPENPGMYKGSGRSYQMPNGEFIDIKQLIDSCEKYLGKHGGHPMACGLSLSETQIPGFIAMAQENAPDIEYDDSLYVDRVITEDKLYEEWAAIAPLMFGEGNPAPVYAMTVDDVQLTPMMGGNGKTSKMTHEDKAAGIKYELISFDGTNQAARLAGYTVTDESFAEQKPKLKAAFEDKVKSVTAVGQLADNVFNGKHTLQMTVNQDYFEQGFDLNECRIEDRPVGDIDEQDINELEEL